MGLIGELLIVERFFVPRIGAVAAMDAWRGPLGETQDFTCVGVCVESKARGRSRSADVQISSEQQLDNQESGRLFLVVTLFDFASAEEERSGISVSDLARRVRAMVAESDERALTRFDALLEAEAFRWMMITRHGRG